VVAVAARPTSLLEGKTVLIAGVGAGLGREIGEVAVREGARVVLGARTQSSIEEEAAHLDPSGERAIPHRLDVTHRQSCADFVAAAVEKFGPVDVLVNLAALDNVFGGIQGADWDDWHKMFEVNVFGSLYMVEACLPHFRPDGAAIVFVGSQTMFDPPPTKLQAGYAASKSAMVGAMRHLTFELGSKGIRLNNVAPGWMWGPPVEGYVSYRAKKKGISEEEVLADLTKSMALNTMATDGDVAEAVIFLASDRARGITGQSLLVNAGEHMH
jgi:NAD(P)-dependent dehydrogenase (short-subunit alcohol dehydrogenase family)